MVARDWGVGERGDVGQKVQTSSYLNETFLPQQKEKELCAVMDV